MLGQNFKSYKLLRTMHIFYPYNEILPKKTAHDVYIFQNCHSLSENGESLTLLCGKGSLLDEELYLHYHLSKTQNLEVCRLPILRKNNILSLSWNGIFNFFSQRHIRRYKPDFVLCSVIKQAGYHFRRKETGVKYVYEVHQLSWYPNQSRKAFSSKAKYEKEVLSKADALTVTTAALREILLQPPYSIRIPIEVIPLAVQAKALPDPNKSKKILNLMYVGQLYEEQGISRLLKALVLTSEVTLDVVGGKKEEIEKYQKMSENLGLENRIIFHGFCPPYKLPELVKDADVFVASFDDVERMPYVAHTKLLEYACWGRPIIAPCLPAVEEHFPGRQGVSLYKANDTKSLAKAIESMKDTSLCQGARDALLKRAYSFSWKARTERYLSFLKNL